MIYAVLLAIIVILLALFGKDLCRNGLRGLAVVALLSAAASLGRVLFAPIPSVQPASFIIILAGQLMGPGAGLAAGLLSAAISTLLTSVTPFAIWQIFLWGLMGLTAGLLRKMDRFFLAAFGAAWGLVFGWVMNFSYYTLGLAPFSPHAFIVSCLMSLPFDAAHAASNAVLALVFPKYVMDKLKAWVAR